LRFAWAREACRLVLAIALVLPSIRSADAQGLSPEISRGLNWLQSQVQADGTLANEAASLATALQGRSESAQALALLATVPPGLADAIAAEPDANTEYLARQALALITAGRDASAQISQLLVRSNADRGFGGGVGFESNPLDTAWTVLALARAGQGAGSVARDARTYLMASLQADGGVAAPSEPQRVEYSALALLALQSAGDTSTASSVRALVAWLLARQGADGSWQGDVHLSALSLIAIAPAVSDPARRAAAAAYLTGKQSAAGSWQDDPFLTALALRALSIGTASPSAATLVGQVIDQSTHLPLQGASVVVNGGSANATSGADGRFSFAGLAAGSYTLQVTRAGYGAASASFTLFAGQTFDAGKILLAQTLATGIVRGRVTAASGALPLPGVTVSITGAAALSTVTNGLGGFEFPAVPPGLVTITASFLGYQSATASASVAGGATLDFSPALYTTAETAPSTGRFIGRTVQAGTTAALPGVSLVMNGSTAAVTPGDGKFDLALPPATYLVVYTLAGYESVSQQFVLAAGATVDAGTVVLAAERTTTSISGRVTDAGGAPLSGATVQLLGGVVATTNSDGAYSLGNLVGSSFDLRVSATGYASQLVTLQVSRPADVLQNFALASSSTTLDIAALQASPASAGANTNIAIATTLSNIGSADASALLLAQVIDVNGAGGLAGAVIGAGLVQDAAGNLLGSVQLTPGATQPVRVVWNSGRFAPGRYAIVLRLVAPESVTAATPQGSLLLEKGTEVDLVASRHFAGSATANPPVLRAGTNTAVKLSALIQNDGNSVLPTQAYTLNVVNTQTGAVAHSQSVNVQALAVSQLSEAAFDDWTPASGGNFRVELTSPDPAEGKISTPLYIGDAGSAQYTTSKLVVPAGTQSVRANIKVTGQDVTGGTISDPLAAPIKAAIQKAVTFADTFGASHYVNDLRCFACHIQTQSVLGGELNRNLATYNAKDRATLVNGITLLQKADGAWHTDGFTASAMLSLWALLGWHDQDKFNWVKSRAADWLLSTQSSSQGQWFSDHGFAWWRSSAGISGINAKNFVQLRKYLAQQPPPAVPRYSASDWPRGAAVTGQWISPAQGADGAVYVARYNEARVDKILEDGSLQLMHSGLNVRDIIVTADGTLYMGAEQGVYRKSASGTLTQLTNKRVSGLARAEDGTLYFAAYAEAAVYKISSSGALTRIAPTAPLSTPGGVALDDDGSVIVADQARNFVYRLAADGSFTRIAEIFTAVGSPGPQPYRVQRWGDKWVATGEGAMYIFDRDWLGERVLYEKSHVVAPLSTGELIFGGNGRIRRLNIAQENLTAKIAALDASIARVKDWLMADNLIDNNDNIQVASRMIGLGAVLDHYKGTALEPGIRIKLEQVGAQLRSRQRTGGSDIGGWTWFGTSGTVDSLVTAMAGVALDYLNPSPQSPEVRNAVTLLLSRQRPDGTWVSEAGVASPPLLTTTWVEIWLPTMLARLGGIDTDLSVTFAGNVTMTNPDKAPASSTSNLDGSKTYVWKLIGVTADGQQINYDLSLADMAVNESRPVSKDAHLTFRNSFTGGNVDAPIDIPRVTASAFLDLGLTTDKTIYGAGTPVNITGQVTNIDGGLAGGTVKFEVHAADDGLVADLGALPFNGLGAGALANLTPTWNTGSTLAGSGFYVLATLSDSQGRFVGSARSSFAIVASDIGTLAATRITSDKQAYLPSDTAQLTSRATNLTQNQPLGNVSLVTTVLNTDGSVRFTKSETLTELVQGALRDFTYAVPIAFAPAGLYSATAVLRDAGGTVLASSSASFSVQSTGVTGSGLTGTLVATPKQVPLGDPATLLLSARNQGNGALAAVPLSLNIVNPQSEALLSQSVDTVDLAAGATHQAARSYIPPGPVGTTYVAVLSAAVGAKTLTLAQDSFTVVAPPVALDVTLANLRSARVLVLLSCSPADGDEACDQRQGFLDAYLTHLGIQHRITTTEADFRRAFRSGAYNTYWESGGRLKISNPLAQEIRESVFRGDALIRDAVHDERNYDLDGALGVKPRGKLNAPDEAVYLAGTLFTAGVLPSVGRPLRLDLITAMAQAQFPASDSAPAIVSNEYGRGRAVQFAYELVRTAMAHPSAELDQAVLAALAWVAPAPASPALARSQVVARSHIANVGPSVDLKAKLTPPAGASVVSSAPVATPDASGRPVWTFTLESGATQDLDAGLRLPEADGSYTATLAVDSIRGGATFPYGAYDLTLTVESAATIAPRLVAVLGAITIPRASERNDRDAAVASVQAAETALASADYEGAIAQLINASQRLLKITSVDISPQRVEIDRILQEAQLRWAETQP